MYSELLYTKEKLYTKLITLSQKGRKHGMELDVKRKENLV